jgi:arsenate reductase (thioredoxin)
MTAHWGIADPVAVVGTDMQKKAAFAKAFRLMSTRINLFLSLPLARIDQLRIKEEMDSIGRTPVTDSSP